MLLHSVVSTILATLQIEGFDVKALRAFRVLRPLRLVSGVPSKFTHGRPFEGPFDILDQALSKTQGHNIEQKEMVC